MSVNYFRAFGVLTLFLNGLVALVLFTAEVQTRSVLNLPLIGKASVVFGATTTIGIGLLFLRKWAAIYFSLALFSQAVWLILSSVRYDPFPSNLFYAALGVALILPTIITIRVWPQLTWGGRWFF